MFREKIEICPECGKKMEYRQGVYKGKFVCTNYPLCEYAVDANLVGSLKAVKSAWEEVFGDHEEDLKNTNI